MASELLLCLATVSVNTSITLKVKRDNMSSWTIACEWKAVRKKKATVTRNETREIFKTDQASSLRKSNASLTKSSTQAQKHFSITAPFLSVFLGQKGTLVFRIRNAAARSDLQRYTLRPQARSAT